MIHPAWLLFAAVLAWAYRAVANDRRLDRLEQDVAALKAREVFR